MKVEFLGKVYEVNHIDSKGHVLTECGRFLVKGEYKILPGVKK